MMKGVKHGYQLRTEAMSCAFAGFISTYKGPIGRTWAITSKWPPIRKQIGIVISRQAPLSKWPTGISVIVPSYTRQSFGSNSRVKQKGIADAYVDSSVEG